MNIYEKYKTVFDKFFLSCARKHIINNFNKNSELKFWNSELKFHFYEFTIINKTIFYLISPQWRVLIFPAPSGNGYGRLLERHVRMTVDRDRGGDASVLLWADRQAIKIFSLALKNLTH